MGLTVGNGFDPGNILNVGGLDCFGGLGVKIKREDWAWGWFMDWIWSSIII